MSKKLLKKKSKILNAGNGLFAKKIFYKGDLVCEYFGMVVPKEQTFESYQLNKENYIKKIHPYVRDLNETNVIVGTEDKDLFKCGVLVNDTVKLKSTETKDMRDYVNESLKNSNVDIIIKDNKAYYRALKRIKKGEEILAHYGIGYWLLEMEVEPKMIAIMNRDMGGFEQFYK